MPKSVLIFWPVVSYERVNKDWLTSSVIYQQWLMNHYPERPDKNKLLLYTHQNGKKKDIFSLRIDSRFLLNNNLLWTCVSFKWSWKGLVYFSWHETPLYIDFHLGTWSIVQLLIIVRIHLLPLRETVDYGIELQTFQSRFFGHFPSYFLLHPSVTTALCNVAKQTRVNLTSFWTVCVLDMEMNLPISILQL